MKKLLILGITALFVTQAKAQIPNPGFEIRHANGTPANWGPSSTQTFHIDTTCIYQGVDSASISTRDAHTGNYAYELRVAMACGDAYSGELHCNRVDADSGFFDQRIPISGQPSAFTFYYKLDPVQGDFGVAEARMDGAAGGGSGYGDLYLRGATATWTKAMIPMQYTGGDTGGYLRLRFYISSAAVLHYGTRFLIDDIGQGTPTGISGTAKAAGDLVCFPSPARNSVTVRMSEATAGAKAVLTITDITGRVVISSTMPVPRDKTFVADTRTLAPGVYCVKLAENGGITTGHSVKQ